VADQYWVNNNSDGAWGPANNWASTSGGSDNTGPPATGDNIIFDSSVTDDCNFTDVAQQGYGTLTMSSGYTGTLTTNRNPTFTGNVDVTDGTINVPSNGFTTDADLYVRSGGTVIFGGSSATVKGTTIHVYSGGTLTINTNLGCNTPTNNTDNYLTVDSGGTLDGSGSINFQKDHYYLSGIIGVSIVIGASLGGNTVHLDGDTTIGGDFSCADADLRWNSHDYDLTLRGDFSWPSTSKWTSGTGTITLSGTAAQDIDFNGESVEDIEIDSDDTVTLSGAVDTKSLTLTDGTLDIDGQNLDITGDFTMAAGTVVNDTDTGGSISIGGNLDINGIDGTGCTWSDADIDTLTGTGDADYCTVSDSNNSSGTAIDATDNCNDSGGNTGWTFAAGGYTLTAAGGAITLTGTAADLTYDRKLSAAAGAIGLTGTAANLEKGYSLTAEAGAITLTGTAAGFLYNQVVSAGAGAIALAGTAADLTYDRKLSAEAGTVTITGADATLTYTQDYSVTAEAGAIALTGTAVALTYDRIMPAAAGAIVLTGADATLLYSQGYNLTAEAGAISLTGAAATLTVDRILTADAAAVALAGTAAGLNVGIVLTAEAGAVALTGTVAGLTYDHVLAAAAGAIALTGTAATLTYSEEQIPVGHVTAAATAGRPGVSISANKPTITIT
jgi:hypothetical protein